MIDLLVFDCDGTLLRTTDAKTTAFAQIGSSISPEAGEAMAVLQKKHGGVHRAEKFAWLYRTFLAREITPDEISELSQRFDLLCAEALDASRPVPGVLEVLDAWHGKIPMYVASGAPHRTLEPFLQKKGLARYFDGIFGAPPGKTELLRLAVRQAGASASCTVMIGDSHSDLAAAERLETLFYGIGADMRDCGRPWHIDFTLFNSWLKNQILY